MVPRNRRDGANQEEDADPRRRLVAKLRAFNAADPADQRLDLYAGLLYGQAVLAEAETLPDPAALNKRLAGTSWL